MRLVGGPNPSIERTLPGKPVNAPHVKRSLPTCHRTDRMKSATRIGWILIAIGAALFLSKIAPIGFVLILLGAPVAFVGHTASALRAQQRSTDRPGADS